MRSIDRIVVHHSEGEGDFASIKRYHTSPKLPGGKGGHGWAHVGYHVVIEKTGRALRGCRDEIIAGGCDRESHGSRSSLEVCLCGHLDKHEPTPAAWSALIDLSVGWCRKYGINPERIVGHRDLQLRKHDPDRPNTCPGNYLYARLAMLRANVKFNLSNSTRKYSVYSVDGA
jgi:N-acetylmuramoyl-L-alanine amidase